MEENLAELEIGSSAASFRKFLDSQKDLFHSQIDQFQNIVVTQCKLTGVNPLSQEMAADALSVKIGKRPRDLLNPKAVTYMQAVFSIKDAVSKKESREISAQFGVTVTQVREFFATQRSRVRKMARLSREKAIKANPHKEPDGEVPTSSGHMTPIDLVPLNTVGPDIMPSDTNGSNQFPLNPIVPSPSPSNSVGTNPVSLNSVGSSSTEEAPSCSTQDEILPGLDDLEKRFVENIFDLLRKEETFSGQVKLMEWILRVENPLVLNWFLNKGGVMILATWLSQAAEEEQTSVLLVTLNVLCHLPLQKACPEHMSAILHSVNRLRFYRTSDISNRARVLLAKWSKMFARSQAMKKSNGMISSTNAQAMILKKSIDDIMGNELWQPNASNSDDISALSFASLENTRKTESSQALKLLPASTDDPSRRHVLGVSHARERRKVQLVEQPGQKTSGRSQATKATHVTQGRPMSVDDIQKAKLRALHMQSKYGKAGSLSGGSNGTKPEEGVSKPLSTLSSNLSPLSKVPVRSKVEEHKKPVTLPPKVLDKSEGPFDPKQKMDSKESLGELSNRVHIPWHTPAEIKLNDLWRVSTGENSKEVDVQKNRNRREMETIYRTVQEIPLNPKEPWDLEMDYDDTLTPEIPIEQPPDADGSETQVSHDEHMIAASAPSLPQIGVANAAEPDLELLAVLLKNPDLVFALTSGQAGNLPIEQTVKLLDMIKNGGTGSASSLNGFVGKVEEKIEVSLPSPTPSSNPGTSGWRQEVAKNPFSQQRPMEYRVGPTNPGVPAIVPSTEKLQELATNTRILQQQSSLQLLSQQLPTPAILEGRQPPPTVPSSHHSLPSNSSMSRTPTSEMALTMKKNLVPELAAATGPSLQVDTMNNVKPGPSVPYTTSVPDRRQVSLSMPLPTQPQTRLHLQPPFVAEPVSYSSRPQPQMLDAWRGRQGGEPSSISHNQNNYDASFGGHLQPRLPSGNTWERNEYVGNDGFESWSPESSPGRSPGYMQGRNYSGPRMNEGWDYMGENGSRQRNPSGYRGDLNRNGSRRWR